MLLRALCQYLNLLSCKTCLLFYHLQFAQQLITNQSRGWGCVFFFLSQGRRIITAHECAWMKHKCLLFWSAVQSQLNPANHIGLPFCFSVCHNRFFLRGCRLWSCVARTWYTFFQAALCSVTNSHVHFPLSNSVRLKPRMPNANQVAGRQRIHHIITQFCKLQEEVLVCVFEPSPTPVCVAVRKRGSYLEPPPPVELSSDFSALNGVLHYTFCSCLLQFKG